MKRVFAFTFLIIFLFNSMGYYFLFELNKYLARTEMQTRIQLKQSKLLVLQIVDVASDADFRWIDHKEFRYKGVMFDVVREIKSGRTSVFICTIDTKESNLAAGLNRINQNRKHIALWGEQIMIFLQTPSCDLSTLYAGDLMFARTDISLKSHLLPTWSPPPEIF
ncbi:MAG: hypothetical protein NTW16_06495 [Bacteroidetes bacterium]|nr:hypothetical protein [Bacteroidota bacterium]